MRIAFICGSIEPGRDGVGDYTRRLAVECIRQGHECRIVALNDKRSAGCETQECDGVQIDCLRLPGSLPWKQRFEQAREFLSAFDPDWISLQFVPYGFHPKGIPWRLICGLKAVIAGKPLQIMFHELWIGFGAAAPLKERCIGALQRLCISRIIQTLKPRAIHTSNATYVGLLKRVGGLATELPLFGNIPVVDLGPESALPAQFVAAGIPSNPASRSGWLLAVFFGTLHPEWEPQPLLGILLRAAKRVGKRLCLVSAGRMGASGEALWAKMQRENGEEIVFIKCGEQSGEQISTLLQIADLGVAVTPRELMGKSGTVAAMFDHGLPVIYTRGDGNAGGSAEPPFFHRCDEALESKLVEGLERRKPNPRVREICARFLASLPIVSRPVPTDL